MKKNPFIYLLILVLLLSCNQNEVVLLKNNHLDYFGLNGSVKQITYSITHNEITNQGYLPVKFTSSDLILLDYKDVDLIFNNTSITERQKKGYDANNILKYELSNFYYSNCSLIDIFFNKEGFVVSFKGQNFKEKEKTFEKIFEYDSKNRLIKTTYVKNEVKLQTKYKYYSNNLVEYCEEKGYNRNELTFENIEKYEYKKEANLISVTLNDSIKGLYSLAIQEGKIKTLTDRSKGKDLKINYDSGNVVSILESDNQGSIINKQEYTYKTHLTNNKLLDEYFSKNEFSDDLIHINYIYNPQGDIFAITDLTGENDIYNKLYIDYKYDEQLNWSKLKYNFDRSDYDRLVKEIEEKEIMFEKYDFSEPQNIYSITQTSEYRKMEIMNKLNRELLFAKKLYNQIEVDRDIIYY